jgi:uncharacterized protein YgbK (DUF1537 family)
MLEERSRQSSPRRLIVADDLTSAVDCAVRMLPWVSEAVVPLVEGSSCRWGGEAAVAIFTDSRESDPLAAYAAVRRGMSWIPVEPNTVTYKSIDSTLRGNLGAEVDAMLDAGAFDGAVVAPAFPHYGRTTVGGRQLLDGRPLEETEFAADPTCPVSNSRVSERLAEQSARGVLELGLDLVRSPAASLAAAIVHDLERAPVLVCDAETDLDLERIARAVDLTAARLLRVGSTGWARAVAAGGRPPPAPVSPTSTRRAAQAVVVVAGSVSEITATQLDVLGIVGAVRTVVPLDALMGEPEAGVAEPWRCAGETAIAGGARLLVLATESRRADVLRALALGVQRGWSSRYVAGRIAQGLAGIAARLLERFPGLGIVATGGETARAVLTLAGARDITLSGEVEPGIPLGSVRARTDFPVAIKAGGFGSPQALVAAAGALLHAS